MLSRLSNNLGVPYFIEAQAFCDYYDSPFCNRGKLRMRTINTNAGNYHIIILPNANMLVHSEPGSVFKLAKKNKKTITDEK